MNDDILDRVALARPHAASSPEVVTAAERDELLSRILGGGERLDVPTARAGRHRTAIAIAAVVAVLMGAAAVIADVGRGNTGDSTASNVSVTPVAVLDRVRLAVASQDDAILVVRGDFGNGVLWHAWFDETEGRSRMKSVGSDGTPMYDLGLTESESGLRVHVVSHVDRAWWDYIAPEERHLASGVPTPEDVRAALREGAMREVGRESLDGRDVIHLRRDPARQETKIIPGNSLWVDADTYLPVRSVGDRVNGKPSVRTDYEWLERSEANLRLFEVETPAEYRHVESAPERRADGGGQG